MTSTIYLHNTFWPGIESPRGISIVSADRADREIRFLKKRAAELNRDYARGINPWIVKRCDHD